MRFIQKSPAISYLCLFLMWGSFSFSQAQHSPEGAASNQEEILLSEMVITEEGPGPEQGPLTELSEKTLDASALNPSPTNQQTPSFSKEELRQQKRMKRAEKLMKSKFFQWLLKRAARKAEKRTLRQENKLKKWEAKSNTKKIEKYEKKISRGALNRNIRIGLIFLIAGLLILIIPGTIFTTIGSISMIIGLVFLILGLI